MITRVQDRNLRLPGRAELPLCPDSRAAQQRRPTTGSKNFVVRPDHSSPQSLVIPIITFSNSSRNLSRSSSVASPGTQNGGP